MSEQEQAPDQGTPENAGTVEETPGTDEQQHEGQQPEVDWQKRYEDMRSEFDRRGTRLSELQQQAQLLEALQSGDADLQRQAYAALGLEIVDDAADDTYADPQDQLAQRLEALEAQIQQRDQQAQQATQIAQIEQHVEQQLAGLDGLDDSDREWIVNTAVAMPPTPEGMPDIQAAHEKFVAWETARQQKWRESKRAPSIKAGGQAGIQAVPLDATHTDRVRAMVEKLENQ